MARFMTRIELHHSTDYTELHAAMLNRGFAKIIQDDETGIWYNLPEAEYHCSSQLSLSEVENPGALTPIRHTNLALNNAGLRGSILVDFPPIYRNRQFING